MCSTLEDLIDNLIRESAWVTLSSLANAHVYGPTGIKRPLLHYAVLVRRLDVLRAVLRSLDTWGDVIQREHIINTPGHRGETLLHLICTGRHVVGENPPRRGSRPARGR